MMKWKQLPGLIENLKNIQEVDSGNQVQRELIDDLAKIAELVGDSNLPDLPDFGTLMVGPADPVPSPFPVIGQKPDKCPRCGYDLED